MFKDYVVIDDFLDDPEELITLSKEIDYFSRQQGMLDGIKLKRNKLNYKTFWQGFRSSAFQEIDFNLHKKYFKKIFEKVVTFNCKYTYQGNCFLHYLPEQCQYSDSWKHKDTSLFAGVVYLNKQPEDNSGTVLQFDSGDVVIENKFNRLVVYRSNIMHYAQGSFGNSVDSSRLTMTFFIDSLNLAPLADVVIATV